MNKTTACQFDPGDTQPAKAEDRQHTPISKQHTTLALHVIYSAEQMRGIRHGLIPQMADDRWFIYADGDTVYMHRSWLGICVFVLRFRPHPEGWCLFEADLNRDTAQYTQTDDAADARRINSVIQKLLLQPRLPPYDILMPIDGNC